MDEENIVNKPVAPKKLDEDKKSVVKRLVPLLIGDKTYTQARAGYWSLIDYEEVQTLASILDIAKEEPVEGDIKGNHYALMQQEYNDALQQEDNRYQFLDITNCLVQAYNESQLETLVREPSLEIGLPVEAFPQMPETWKEQYKAERQARYTEPETLTEWHSGPNQVLREIYGIEQTKPVPPIVKGSSPFKHRTERKDSEMNELDEWWQDDYGKYLILKFFEDKGVLSQTQKETFNELRAKLDTKELMDLKDLTGNFIRAAKVLTEHKYMPEFYAQYTYDLEVADDASDVEKLVHAWVSKELEEVFDNYAAFLDRQRYDNEPRLSQFHAVHKAKEQKRFGVWDTMGAGKTLTAIIIDDEYNKDGKTLILGPKSSRGTWAQYENDEREFMTFEEFSNTDVDEYDHVIIDEAHLSQVCNTKSETDSGAKTIAQKIRDKTEHTKRLTLLSGTPIRNNADKDYKGLRRLLRPNEKGTLANEEITLELHTYGIRRDHTILNTTIPQTEQVVHTVYAPQESLEYAIALHAKQAFHTKREKEMSMSPARIQAIKDNIENLDGKHVIISRLVDGVHDKFDALQINGTSNVNEVVHEYNKDKDVVIISSAKAQSYDLSAADHVHILGYGTDLGNLEQALARVIRPSENQQEKTVQVHHYLRRFDESDETFGSRLKNWMAEKKALIDEVYVSGITTDDLDTIHHGLQSIITQYDPEKGIVYQGVEERQQAFHDTVCEDRQCAFCDNHEVEAVPIFPYSTMNDEQVMDTSNGLPLCTTHTDAYNSGEVLLAHNGTSFVVAAYSGSTIADITTVNERLQHVDPTRVNARMKFMETYLQGKPVDSQGREQEGNWNRLAQSTLYTMETV